MNNRIEAYIGNLFINAPNDPAVFELKEELVSNATEKYNDLLENGMNEDAAFKQVTKGIGNINELLQSIGRRPHGNGESIEKRHPRKEYRVEDTLDEELKTDEPDEKTSMAFVKFISPIFWMGITIVYLLISFATQDWHVSWVIFTLGTAMYNVMLLLVYTQNKPVLDYRANKQLDSAQFKKENKRYYKRVLGYLSAILWTVAVSVYFIISFSFPFIFGISWIIYLIAAFIQVSVANFFKYKYSI